MDSLITSTTGGERLKEIYKWLLFNIPKGAISFCLEAPSLNSTNLIFDLGEVSGIVKLFANKELGLEARPIEPLVVKKFITGNAHSDKNAVMQALEKFWSVKTTDDDAADAFALAQIARGYSQGWRIFTRRHEAETMRELLETKQVSKKVRIGKTI